MKVVEYGNRNNDIVVLLHDVNTPYQIWKEYIEHFEKDYLVLIPVIPGHYIRSNEEFTSFNMFYEFTYDYITLYKGKLKYLFAFGLGVNIALNLINKYSLRFENIVFESAILPSLSKQYLSSYSKDCIELDNNLKMKKLTTVNYILKYEICKEKLETYMDFMYYITEKTIRKFFDEALLLNIDNYSNIEGLLSESNILYIYSNNTIDNSNTISFLSRINPNVKSLYLRGNNNSSLLKLNPRFHLSEVLRELGI